MAFGKIAAKDEIGRRRMMSGLSPGGIDNLIRQSLQMLWIVLPEERRTVADVEREFRRMVDRALKDLREDNQAFGLSNVNSNVKAADAAAPKSKRRPQ